jgi:hypothetical protein
LDSLVDKRKALDEKFEAVDALTQDKMKNSRWDREDAGLCVCVCVCVKYRFLLAQSCEV